MHSTRSSAVGDLDCIVNALSHITGTQTLNGISRTLQSLSMVVNVEIDMTGPKISSRAMVLSVMPTNIVGWMNQSLSP